MVQREKGSSRGLERCSPIVTFFFAANAQSPQQISYGLPINGNSDHLGLRNHELANHDEKHKPLMVSAVEVKCQLQKKKTICVSKCISTV